jgi:formylmethanofuran dehydrogenase subunit E
MTTYSMSDFQAYLEASAARHSHLCPRQILGVRVALIGVNKLGLSLPRKDKRLLVISETDGCFVDGLEVVTGATVGHRTLRIEDLGKIAATFVDVKHGGAVRIAPVTDLRERAWVYAPEEKRHYFAQLKAYQRMPAEEMFSTQAFLHGSILCRPCAGSSYYTPVEKIELAVKSSG